jgi:hypothetical protein
MFWNRWHLAWLGVCFVVATGGAFFLVLLLALEGPPQWVNSPIELVQFLLAIYTLPLVGFYLAGIALATVARLLYRGISRGPFGRGRSAAPRALATR